MGSLEAVLHFFESGKIETSEDDFFLSQNRGEFTPRLTKLAKFSENSGFDLNRISLIVSCAGEIGNNSFDHNLGYWKDQPGLVMGWSLDREKLTIGFADRGRGIVSSLRAVIGTHVSSQEILNMAFEKVISGRAPEKRGNGLKFVRNSLLLNSLNTLICYSNNYFYKINQPIQPIPGLTFLTQDFGTLIYLQWSRK